MADTYIDIFECVEYCNYLADEAVDLVAMSELVDAQKLSERARAMAVEIQGLLEKGEGKRSALRGERDTIKEAVPAARRVARRYYGYLISVEDEVKIDFEAFYAQRKVGELARMKPADLEKALTRILRGFAAPANAALPDKDKWQKAIADARDALTGAVAGRGSARKQAISMTAELSAARARCLAFYNGTAKRLVYGILNDAGRLDEYRLFFLDLQVNEDGSGGSDDEPSPGTEPDGGVPSKPPIGTTPPINPSPDSGGETA